ncbi:MAG: FG-GAP-like repeat-containing protein [Bryobacterales bacterium]
MAQSLSRRRFLQATTAAGLWGTLPQPLVADVFPVQFLKSNPYEELYRYIAPGSDEFAIEKEAAEITAVLNRLIETRSLPLAQGFRGRSPLPARYRKVSDDVSEAEYSDQADSFPESLDRWLSSLGQVENARFFVLGSKRVRYEISSRNGGALEYRVGLWLQVWSEGKLTEFEPLEETLARSSEPLFADVTSKLFGAEESFREQMRYGVPYWRSRIDSASGIDVYGQNGIAVGDIDNDGRDEIYVCQPGGLPNRLYKRRGDGTFEDITERAGVGLLDNTACALFVDFRNIGSQDLVVLTSSGPLCYLNHGDGVFHHKPDAFRFRNPPAGTFTGMSAADYDGDGLVDLYLCTYIYFQSEDQYSYPAPYHDARNGPPNFLFRNQLSTGGEGFFEDVTEAAGLNQNNDRYSFAPAWCDYNGDGRPDLYVANDFGRNNLYKNEGGTFRDVAAEAGVEDLGPGMSAAWLDYDGDGRPDLYVTNMWSAAGQRLIESESFQPVARDKLDEPYRRHAKGNTLYRNRGDGTFEETSGTEHVEMGRWSWTGDALDFDCDGTPEIYVTAGMLTNSPETNTQSNAPDLMSFFWRQVVAKSPPALQAASGYENGWNAINQLIREDYSWNGREPNVFYARRGKRYYDLSGISGLDFADDSRAFAATDFSGDGRLDIILKSRLGPQIRALENRAAAKNNVVVLALEGTKSNRDAIGAWVIAEHENGKTAQALQAGSGYLSQHTKRLHIGLGSSKEAKTIVIRWPNGQTEKLTNVASGHLYRVREGSGIIEGEALDNESISNLALRSANGRINGSTDQPINRSTFEPTWLLEPVPLPEKHAGPGYVCLTAEPVTAPQSVPFRIVRLDQSPPEVAAWYALFRRYLFDFRTGLTVPMLLLIDEQSRAHKIYPAIPAEHELQRDLKLLNAVDRAALALPFAGYYHQQPSRNYFRHGTAFFHAGYPEQALGYLEEVIARNPKNFKAQLAIGQIHLGAYRTAEARRYLDQARALKTDSPELWNNIGGVQMAENNYAAAAGSFERALALEPDLAFALVNAGQAYAQLQRLAEAEKHFRRALEINPNDAEAANQLGLLLIRQDRPAEAKKLLQQAIAADRAHVSAINNLAVLYIKENQLQDAIAALRYGIGVAPQAEMLYLNLARIYVQSGDRDRARDILQRLQAEKPDSAVARNALRELGAP